MSHGDQTYVVRIRKEYFQGDCLEIVAPVGKFDDDIQFDISDFDWAQDF
jgi:hypothetical protein